MHKLLSQSLGEEPVHCRPKRAVEPWIAARRGGSRGPTGLQWVLQPYIMVTLQQGYGSIGRSLQRLLQTIRPAKYFLISP
jgi:hypothetical protein